MTLKATILFNLTTGGQPGQVAIQRSAGWSETLYWATDIASLKQALLGGAIGPGGGVTGLLPLRAQLLPATAQIVGFRVQAVNPTGQTTSFGNVFPGNVAVESDYPQGCLLCTLPGLGVRNVRRLMLRGLPDFKVSNGEYLPDNLWDTGLRGYFNALGSFQFRGLDLTQPSVNIVGITVAGVATLTAPPVYNVNDVVQVLRSKDATGHTWKGKFTVTAVGPGNQVTLSGWVATAPTTGGMMRRQTYIFPTIDSTNIGINRVIVRKVGRPFVQFRGRRSKRR